MKKRIRELRLPYRGASQQDIKESFQTAALAGGGADIVVMDNSGHAIDLAAMGLLYSLEELTTDEELTAQYQEGPLDSGKFEGKYYSVPWYMDCTGLYYNTERLDELGIDVPTTWEELSDAVDKAKKRQDTVELLLIRVRMRSIHSSIRMSVR